MPKRILGRSKVEVSLLSFGVLAVKNEEIYRRAVDLGVTYFHFAADQNTRKLLAPDKHNYQAITALRPVRNRLVVSYMTIKRDTKSIMLQDLDEFLQASGFGHLDFWYLCCPSPGQWNDFCEAVGEARRAGKVRFAAISTHALPEDMERLTAPGSPIDAVMLTYNFTSSAEDRERVAKLHAAGLGIVSMKPLAGRFYEVTTARPDAALRWLAADSRVHTIPVAMEKLEQLDQNRAALRWPLSDQDKQDLVAHLDFVSPRFCRMCGECRGTCPNGLAVSDLVRVAMYSEGYGNKELARHHFEAIPAAQRRSVCDLCSECSVHCRNGVAVRERILRAQQVVA